MPEAAAFLGSHPKPVVEPSHRPRRQASDRPRAGARAAGAGRGPAGHELPAPADGGRAGGAGSGPGRLGCMLSRIARPGSPAWAMNSTILHSPIPCRSRITRASSRTWSCAAGSAEPSTIRISSSIRPIPRGNLLSPFLFMSPSPRPVASRKWGNVGPRSPCHCPGTCGLHRACTGRNCDKVAHRCRSL